MRDDPALHLDTKSSKGTSLLLLFCISVTVGSSTMSITHTSTMRVIQLLAYIAQLTVESSTMSITHTSTMRVIQLLAYIDQLTVVFNNEHNSYQYNESDTAPSLHRLAHSRVFNNEHNSYQYNESDTAPSLHKFSSQQSLQQ